MTKTTKIGNVEKEYKGRKFNPYKALDYIYDYCLCHGTGAVITVVGYGEFFGEKILPALHHVQRDRGLLKGRMNHVEYNPITNEVETHTGAVISFVGMSDLDSNSEKLTKICNESKVVALCSEYNQAILKTIIKDRASNVLIYDFSNNNEEIEK